jgi:hypothetical protein
MLQTEVPLDSNQSVIELNGYRFGLLHIWQRMAVGVEGDLDGVLTEALAYYLWVNAHPQ